MVHSTVAAWNYFGDLATIGLSWFPAGPIEYIEHRFKVNEADPSTFPTSSVAEYQIGIADIGFSYSACFEKSGPGGGAIIDPAAGPPGTSFDLVVNDAGTLLDLDVQIKLKANGGASGSPTFWDDLAMTLSKGSRTFPLNAHPTGSVNGIFDVTFDAQAAASIATAKPGTGDAIGPYQPDGGVLTPFDGVSLAGEWTLNFEDVGFPNNTQLESWALVGQVTDEQALIRCDDPLPEGGGDTASLRGIRFHVDQDFQAVRLELKGTTTGAYTFDAELRRSTGFTAAVEVSVPMQVDLVSGRDISVPIYFDDVAVSGSETFTLKLTNFSGGTVYLDTYGLGANPCPDVEETSQNNVADPSVRGDPKGFSVIAIPEPAGLLMLASGTLLLMALRKRR
jgi:hypothetical protein